MANIQEISIRHRLLDLTEQIVVLILFSWLVARMWPEEFSATNWYPLLILFSEGLVVLLLVIRRPTVHISTDIRDWVLAASGTFMALLIGKGGEPLALALGVFLLLCGIIVHVGAKLSLWRSFGLVAANRGLKVGGLYAFLRHPMYAGYILSQVGFLLVSPSWWNLLVYLAVWTLLVMRIYAEERILSLDPEYVAFKTGVRYRILPGVF